jgi:4-hydroxy-2-oxoheptanedioate aldolase
MTAAGSSSPYGPSGGAGANVDGRPLRAKFQSGEVTLGVMCAIPSGFTVELLAATGFDWLCIDMQHGLVGYHEMVEMLRAADTRRIPVLVRVAWNRPELMMAALDAGAAGIVAPMVESAEDARRIVHASRYPPLGGRSWGPARAALHTADYTPEQANAATLCVVMIETPAAVARADEILSTPGIDAVYIGPWDLSLAIHERTPTPGGDEADRQAIEKIRETAERHGVTPGIACGGADQVERWIAAGFRMIAVNSDVGLLVASASSLLESGRRAVAARDEQP